MVRYKYMGDVNLEYGGTFYNFSDWRWGYVNAVEITDLDSACGFRGAVLIEQITINVKRPGAELDRALDVIGAKMVNTHARRPVGDILDNGRLLMKDTAAWRWCIAYACQAYGHKDVDKFEVVQLEKDGALQFDGWRAERRLRQGASLRNYVKNNWLKG